MGVRSALWRQPQKEHLHAFSLAFLNYLGVVTFSSKGGEAEFINQVRDNLTFVWSLPIYRGVGVKGNISICQHVEHLLNPRE